MIDTHTHVDTRPYEDFEAMALAGITDVLTLAHDPFKMSASSSYPYSTACPSSFTPLALTRHR